MENLKNKLLREAKALKTTKKILFFIPVSSPDYESSAEKFREVAQMCHDKQEKINYLLEATKSYLMNPVEYNRYNTYLIYLDIAEIYGEGHEAINLYIKSGDMALSCDKKSLAARSYEKASDLSDDINKKIELMSKIVECYDSKSWENHRIHALKQLAFTLFKNGEYEKAAQNFLLIKSSIYNLCAGICYYLVGVDTDLEVSNEHIEVYEALSKGPEELRKSIEHYLDNYAVEKEVRKIMETVVEKMRPENDIL